MTRTHLIFGGALLVVGALLFANLLRPSPIQAYSLPDVPTDEGPHVAISADKDSAWVVLGNKVYYVTLKSRSAVESRTITVIDDETLR